jgi:replicative DNA helicase
VSADLLDIAAAREAESRPIGSLVNDALTVLERNEPDGRPTGFRGVDRLLGGLRPGQLILVASRPSVGKTALAAQVARNVAKQAPVALFSLEMSAEEIAVRLLCADAEVDFARMRGGQQTTEDWSRLIGAAESLMELPLQVFDRASVKLPDVRALARRVKGLGLIVVDYLQLLRSDARWRGSRQEEVAEMSRGLKLLAKELGVPVVACCQLNRDPERRQDKRPQLSDLRESGSLEQDSDAVLLLHRGADDPSHAEIIVAKQRNGPTGTTRVSFDRAHARFRDVSW